MAFECVNELAVPKCKEPRSEPSNLCDEHLVPATVFAHGNSTGAATEPDVTLISPANDTTVSTALVLVSKPVCAEDELATCVASFTTEYNILDSEINDLTDDLLGEERKLAVRYRDELLPRIGQMQMLLSQRGALHELVANNRSLLGVLAQLEDVPTWTEWYEAFASRFQGAMSLRTVQRQLKKLRSGTGPTVGADTSSASDDTDGGADERSFHSGLYRDDEAKTGAELIAEYIKQMENILAGKSIISDGMRIKRAIGLLKDLQCAVEEGFLFDAPPVAGNERVGVAPHKSDSTVSTLNADTGWKQVLVELIDVLEQYGEKLPVPVLNKKRAVEKLLDGKDLPLLDRKSQIMPTKRYHKIGKLDSEGNRCWAVKADREKKVWGTFEAESDADEAIANLNSPVVSLMDIGDAPKILPASAPLVGSGCLDLHDNVA
jgi:hypothetical protein